MAWKNLSLQNALEGAATAARRFPLTLLSSLFGTGICFRLLALEGKIEGESGYLLKLLIFSWLGLILFFDLELIAERYGFSPKKRWLVFAGGLAALAAYYFFLPDILYDSEGKVRYLLQLFLFSLGLHLLASFAPYFNPRTENGFWQFNEKLFLRFLIATLYSGVLFVGICVALVAIKELFQVHLDEKIFARLWLFMAGVFHPWFFLAGVPHNLKALETETAYPKGLKVFTQFVLLPLVTVYLLILYFYLGKIILAWSWPRGWVSYLVLSFSMVGIFSLLLIHPVRHTQGNTWINTYAKGFYLALFPLLILLALAIWRRVSDYGITEERYFVLLLAGWLLAVALYFLLSRKKNIKFIPVTLCLLAFLAACGPWGAFAVSRRSQVARLEKYLAKNGMLSGEKAVPAKKKIPPKDEAEISAILVYLGRKHDFEGLEALFGSRLDSVQENDRNRGGTAVAQAGKLMNGLNLGYRYGSQVESARPEPEYFRTEIARSPVQHVSGYDYSFNVRVSVPHYDSEGQNHRFALGNTPFYVRYARKPQQIWFRQNADSMAFDLQPLLAKLAGKERTDVDPAEMTHVIALKNARVKLVFEQIRGYTEEKQTIAEYFELTMFVKTPIVLRSESGE